MKDCKNCSECTANICIFHLQYRWRHNPESMIFSYYEWKKDQNGTFTLKLIEV